MSRRLANNENYNKFYSFLPVLRFVWREAGESIALKMTTGTSGGEQQDFQSITTGVYTLGR